MSLDLRILDGLSDVVPPGLVIQVLAEDREKDAVAEEEVIAFIILAASVLALPDQSIGLIAQRVSEGTRLLGPQLPIMVGVPF